ncbi:hypothetical protein PtA15_16A399 [Puccinia triticina]|uniref:Uncharacterized protein n=1 Tax=Puccinia triticina TaxID=208348 RepID=A0ABY7D513_9BASI|nr:uncharacterized protein PtA15_16A399 [Puccinia triticina]WAQ92491.1 hypothetical protein PtA15_16A399 [Puccinia triticina]
MVIKALNTENLRKLERENTTKVNGSKDGRTSIINRFLSNQTQPPQEHDQQPRENVRSVANRSTGSSVPLEPRVSHYYHHPKAPAQQDHQSSVVDRAELLRSRAEIRLATKKDKRKNKKSDIQSQKSSQPKKTKKKVSALSWSIKRLPDSLPNPGRSKNPRLTIDRQLPSHGIFQKAVFGSAARRNTWGGDLTFNKLSFLDKEWKSQRKTKEKGASLSISSQKKKSTIAQETSKSPVRSSAIDPCKIRPENARPKSTSRSTRHSNLPSSGHSAYSLLMRAKAARQSGQPVPSTSHEPHPDRQKSSSSSKHQASPDKNSQDGQPTYRVEQPPVEESQSCDNHHQGDPDQPPHQSTSSHTRLIINQPVSSRSSLVYSAIGYGNNSFTHANSSIGALNPNDHISSRTFADDYQGISNSNDYMDEENEELGGLDRLSLLLEGSELDQSNEMMYYPSAPHPAYLSSRQFRSGGAVGSTEAYNESEDLYGEWAESDGYQEDGGDGRPDLVYDHYEDEEVDGYYDEDTLRFDGRDHRFSSLDEKSPLYPPYREYTDYDEEEEEDVEWPQPQDPPIVEQWYPEDGRGVAELDYAEMICSPVLRGTQHDRLRRTQHGWYFGEPVANYYRPSWEAEDD